MPRNGRILPVNGDYRRSRDLELNKTNHVKNSRRKSSTENWDKVSKEIITVSRWKDYARSMRQIKRKDNLRSSKIHSTTENSVEQWCVLDSDVEDLGRDRTAMYDTNAYMKPLPAVNDGEPANPSLVSSRAVIIYFAQMAKESLESEKELDFDFIERLLEAGADLNFTDRYGQTILHEVARIWHVDVAKFVLENGGGVNKADNYGRTPLHVAAAVDYPEMVEFLVRNGADLHALTYGEDQTPTHYAAKNDAVRSLKVLLKLGGRVHDRDYKKRTPLQVAAELDRSETAKFLIDEGVPAGLQDDAGSSVMSFMISKMPPVAKDGLDQLHTTDRGNRKQYFYLNHLEPYLPNDEGHNTSFAKSPLHCVVHFKQMELIMHPVFKRLIEVKWDQFGRRGTIKNICIHLFFVMLWTALGVTLHLREQSDGNYYSPPSKYWWRIVLESLACLMTIFFIGLEFFEITASKKSHQRWKTWRVRQIERDLKHCHPRWPEERKYLEMERDDVANSGISYFNDSWNYFDWVTYAWILGIIVTRIFSVVLNSETAQSLHPRVFAIALIFIWLRLMKVFRGFVTLGPFIVMIGHIIDDTLKFGFLYFDIYLPYVCAFWIVFGGSKNAAIMESQGQDSKGWENFNDLMYSVWQLTVVGNYPWDSLLVVDRLMAQILCGTYLAVSAIVMLNLFIALMSDTFQRVYDNARANAAMQRASTILTMEENMSEKTREHYRRIIHRKFAPQEMYYDDDSTQPGSGELERMTHQIKDVVDEVHEMLEGKNEHGGRTEKALRKEIERLRHDLAEVSSRHEDTVKEMRNEVAEMKALLVSVLQNGSVQSPHSILPSIRSLQPKSPKQKLAPIETRPSSKRSSSSRLHRKKHRRQPEYRSDEGDGEEDYQGLPLTDEAEVPNELPSVSVLASRSKSSHKLQREDHDNSF